jgi:hypothetical protein
MATPDTKNSIVIYKEGNYRGATRRWSNRYHFEGALPTDDAAWEAFSDLIVAQEKTVLNAATTGDAASLVRYSTGTRSRKNHPIYLMNYYHSCYSTTGDGDNLAADQKTALENYADAWVTGFVCDGSHRERCGPRGAVATGRRVDPYVRHRDFPS